MGQAGPIPHLPENGQVVAFTPGRPATEVASGARLIVDVEFGCGGGCTPCPRASGTCPDAGERGCAGIAEHRKAGAGRKDGSFTSVVEGLDRPTSLEFVGNTAFVVTLTGKVIGSTACDRRIAPCRVAARSSDGIPSASGSAWRCAARRRAPVRSSSWPARPGWARRTAGGGDGGLGGRGSCSGRGTAESGRGGAPYAPLVAALRSHLRASHTPWTGLRRTAPAPGAPPSRARPGGCFSGSTGDPARGDPLLPWPHLLPTGPPPGSAGRPPWSDEATLELLPGSGRPAT